MGTLQIASQFFPPNPKFTEKTCPDQSHKVFLVTGGYSGVGLELSKILYQKNATVYVAGRSESKASSAIEQIRSQFQASKGKLAFLFLDLNDLETVKAAVGRFQRLENRLDGLWNNAGVMFPPTGSTTKQGYEMQLGSNTLAHFLLTRLLYPVLIRTATNAPPDSVRVCWAGSLYVELSTPQGIVNFDDINYVKGGSKFEIYSQSKVANVLLSSEFAKRFSDSRVLHFSFNPGNLRSGLQRHGSQVSQVIGGLLLHNPVFGAYTELYAGLSPELSSVQSGSYILPWGRLGKLKPKLYNASLSEEEGGTGIAARFYEWCDQQVRHLTSF